MPQRDTSQTDNIEKVFKANTAAIREADLVVAVLINYGRDLGFEVGFAYALGKQVIVLAKNRESKRDKMVARALTDVAYNMNELPYKL